MPTKTTKKSTTSKKTAASPASGASAQRTSARSGTRRTRSKTGAQTPENALPSAEQSGDGKPWTRVDLHMHTPGSHDYEQPEKTYIDILRQAERRGLGMIAFTDHNTVNGYRFMHRDIETLELLERSERIRPDEMARLTEYRRLLKKIVVLPGFEFTATFGFHILGLFPPEKSVREIEHVLMQLRVPNDVIEHGLTEAGATSDVLTAYQLINAAGGIAIAAHANSSSGVSMRNMNLGGQTRIAFTQDPNLLAIEFTDLDKGARRSSAFLFSGIKPEYPRRMFAIQGSDAHRVIGDPSNPKRLGVGDRTTEMQLDTVSHQGLRELFVSNEFQRARPVFDRLDLPPDMSDVTSAREAGANASVAFHPALPKKGDRVAEAVRDVVAMANGNGGVVFLGCGDKSVKKVAGVSDANKVAAEVSKALQTIAPPVSATVMVIDIEGKDCVRISLPAGKNAPYALNAREFFVRKSAETTEALRDDIVALARRSFELAAPTRDSGERSGRDHRDHRNNREGGRDGGRPQHQTRDRSQHSQQRQPAQEQGQPDQQQRQPDQQQRQPQQQQQQRPPQQQQQRPPQQQQQRPPQQQRPLQPRRDVQPQSNVGSLQLPRSLQGAALQGGTGRNNRNGGRKDEPKIPDTPVEPVPSGAPKTGVQVLSMDERSGAIYFAVRDLRNNSVVRNVTMKSARDLWHYAISQYAEHPGGPEEIDWRAERAILAGGVRAGKLRYDLALKDAKGSTHVFYGVMQDGLDDAWKALIAEFDANGRQTPAPSDHDDDQDNDDDFDDIGDDAADV